MRIGTIVRIDGLANATYYNGLEGKIVEVFESDSRVLVALEGGRQLKMKFQNVTPVGPAPEQLDESGGENASKLNCAVCYEEMDVSDRAVMPCCGTKESSVQYCRRCIEIIIERGIDGKIGRCPTCSAFITLRNGTIQNCDQVGGRCRMCCQLKVIVDPQNVLCELCLLGARYRFQYECARCHRQQMIPHPMWQYQQSATEFGTTTWACHVGCGDYTTWRVVPEDLQRIPPELCPPSWGRRDEWLAAVREQRLAERGGDADADAAGGGGEGRRCTIS